MPRNFDKSEDFRAQIFFATGIALNSPFGLIVTGLLETGDLKNLIGLIFSTLLMFSGVFLILKSYDIMYSKGILDASNKS
jgi:hypothetical protein